MLVRREVLKLGTALAVSGSMPPFIQSTFAATASARFNWKLYPPSAAGMSSRGLEGLRAAIQKNIDARNISGAVTAVARRNKLVWHEAQGWADVDARRPMQKDSLFRMMSSSKVVTAVAVMMILEEGKIALEDPVSKFIPGFRNQKVAVAASGNTDPAKVTFVPATRDITVKDLLTHTSGLSSFGEGIVPGLGSLINKAQRGPGATLASVVPQFGSYALDFQPGTRWRYSPLDGIDTLLYLVELVSGVPADRFLKERIFEPLDMRGTYFNVPDSQKNRLVNIYAAKGGKFETRPWLFGDGPFTYFSGAGGLISCAHDMLNFELMLLNRGSFNGHRLLRPETVALMSRNHVGRLFADWVPFITGGHGFGLGVRIVEDESRGEGKGAGAFGWGGAYGTETWADPKLELAGVMLIQMDNPPANVKADFSNAIRNAIVA